MPSWYQAGNERFRGAVPTAAVAGYTGPGDIKSGAYAWWGLQAYNAAYAAPGNNPAIDLGNDSTGVFAGTVNILSTGKLDIATASTLILGGSSRITKWYDQTGNGRHQLQQIGAGRNAQLQLTAGPGGNTPAAFFDAQVRGDQYGTTGAATIPQPYSYALVAKASSASTGNFYPIGDGSSSTIYLVARHPGLTVNVESGGGELGMAVALNAWFSWQAAVIGNTTSTIQVDSTSNTGGTIGTSGYTGTIGWGVAPLVNSWDGWLSQGGIWPLDNTLVLTAMNTNQHTNWGF